MASWEGRSGWRSALPILTTILVMFVASVPSIAATPTVEGKQATPCPHPKGWKPADLPRILAEHQKWLEKWFEEGHSPEWAASHPEGRANLCNADLSGAQLTGADLGGAQMDGAYLSGAQLTGAFLFAAQLTKADLSWAQLTKANLRWAQLTGAYLSGAQLTGADLVAAQLTKANLGGAQMEGTRLAGADVTGALYAPASPPPDPYVTGIKGLRTITFPQGEEVGLVQLRELIQKAGLRDLEREATYALEHGRTWHALAEWKTNPVHAAEGAFRFIAFDLTTAYGLHPARALIIIITLWAALIPVYDWPIRLSPKQTDQASGIYRIWPNDRIEVSQGAPTVDSPAEAERLQGGLWTAFGWAAYFSLLSAFHIGFREFNVGTWLSRLQAREYTLKPIGWVRVVSGVQSLISVYLLAIWALTYFGRPFP